MAKIFDTHVDIGVDKDTKAVERVVTTLEIWTEALDPIEAQRKACALIDEELIVGGAVMGNGPNRYIVMVRLTEMKKDDRPKAVEVEEVPQVDAAPAPCDVRAANLVSTLGATGRQIGNGAAANREWRSGKSGMAPPERRPAPDAGEEG